MASWMVHLRIAEELLPSLGRINETAFVFGNMAPDSGVPNEDWTEFDPPNVKTHFKTRRNGRASIDIAAFCERYFNEKRIRGYSLTEYSFFLGYYVHLLTDIQWSGEIVRALVKEYPTEAAEDREKLIRDAKEDWYDLDYLFLEQHPKFRAFSVYESAEHFENVFMDMFRRDAFENRRRYICDFYRTGEHGDLHRQYRFLTADRAESFVRDASKYILEHVRGYIPEQEKHVLSDRST